MPHARWTLLLPAVLTLTAGVLLLLCAATRPQGSLVGLLLAIIGILLLICWGRANAQQEEAWLRATKATVATGEDLPTPRYPSIRKQPGGMG
jgi:uncharacterized membrane protein HdeD (DUF308 family)